MKTAQEIHTEATESFQQLHEFNPEAMSGFLKYVHAIDKDSALSAKMKQIILVSVSLAKQCEWCIVYHTKKALDLGATRDELLEACLTTSLMDGGPAMMHTQIVLKAIAEFEGVK